MCQAFVRSYHVILTHLIYFFIFYLFLSLPNITFFYINVGLSSSPFFFPNTYPLNLSLSFHLITLFPFLLYTRQPKHFDKEFNAFVLVSDQRETNHLSDSYGSAWFIAGHQCEEVHQEERQWCRRSRFWSTKKMNPLCVCVCVCVMAPFYSLTLYEFSLHWNDKIVFICIWISILS